MKRRFAFMAVTVAAVLPLSVVHSADAATAVQRPTGVFATSDPGGDFVFARNRGGVTYKTAKNADIRALKVSYGFFRDTDALAFRIKVNKVAGGKSQQVYTAITRTFKGTTQVAYNRTTGKTVATRGTRKIACANVGVLKTRSTVTVVVPRACFGGTKKVRVGAMTQVVTNKKVRVTDRTRLSKLVTLNTKALRTWTFTEAGGDVTYVGDPAASNYAADSVDLTAARYVADKYGVVVGIGVADVSYYSWDVKQQYFVDWLTSDGKVRGTLVLTPNRTEDGTMTVTGAGAWVSCATAASFKVVNEVGVSGRVPQACLSGKTAKFRVRSQVTSEANAVLGTDSTVAGKPVMIG